jgi:hypothetical protein
MSSEKGFTRRLPLKTSPGDRSNRQGGAIAHWPGASGPAAPLLQLLGFAFRSAGDDARRKVLLRAARLQPYRRHPSGEPRSPGRHEGQRRGVWD